MRPDNPAIAILDTAHRSPTIVPATLDGQAYTPRTIERTASDDPARAQYVDGLRQRRRNDDAAAE